MTIFSATFHELESATYSCRFSFDADGQPIDCQMRATGADGRRDSGWRTVPYPFMAQARREQPAHQHLHAFPRSALSHAISASMERR